MYKDTNDLPDSLKHSLPHHAQEIYLEAFNHAWEGYADTEKRRGNETQEEVAHRVAWGAVERVYKKENGRWVKKSDG